MTSKKVHYNVLLSKIAPSFLQHQRSQRGRGGEETKAIHLGYFSWNGCDVFARTQIKGSKRTTIKWGILERNQVLE